MAVKIATGMVLIRAPASALNNAGLETGRIAENKVIVKKIRVGRDELPYVSGQAVKRWWRETIQEKFGWSTSPVIREEKVAYTSANPIQYEEDDIFGYMLAPKQRTEEALMVSGLVYRRIAPLKCTPLISLFPNVITGDFGVFSRGDEALAEPVPYEQEFYSTTLKGTFSIMLNEVGVFTRGRSMDLPKPTDAEEVIKKKKPEKADKQIKAFMERVTTIEKLAKEKKATVTDTQIILPPEERKRRIKETLLALTEFAGGAKRSDYLTDVAPRFIIGAILGCANHIFMDAIKTEEFKIRLDTEAIEEVVRDYHNSLLSSIFIGLRKGFFDDQEYNRIATWAKTGIQVKIKTSENKEETKTVNICFCTPKEAVASLVETLEKMNL